jgi:hypothetical protein
MKHDSDSPSDLTGTDQRNWNFDAVPKPQLQTYCLYEYARESASIRDAVRLAREAKDRQGIPLPETPERAQFRNSADNAFAVLHRTGYELRFWLYLPFPRPWLSVDEHLRQQWAGVKPRDLSARPQPPFQLLGETWATKLLYDSARQSQQKRNAVWSEVARRRAAGEPYPDLSKLLYETQNPPPVSLCSSGFQTFVAQVNWRDWPKPQIKNALCVWVDTNAPSDIPEPSERGHKPLDWKRKLRDLGVMRLMHDSEVGNMKRRHPDAWKLYHDQAGWPERYWYLARNRASQHFHTLLQSHPLWPSEPTGELPISWKTKAERTKHPDCK